MPQHNGGCLRRATSLERFGAIFAVLTVCALARGQDVLPKHPDGEERKVAKLTTELLLPPSPQRMMDAFSQVRKWIDAWEVTPSDETKIVGDSSGAVCLTLRFGGRIVGRSVEVGGPDALERAARDAMKDASAFFGGKSKPENASRICISLEAAGALIPYQPSSYDDTDLEIPAGIDGVAARAGQGEHEKLRVVFPSMMLTFGHGMERSVGSGGQSPGDALAACAAYVLEDPAVGIRSDSASDPAKLMRDRKVTFYRFEVSHLAQITPVDAPVFLYRQGRVIPEREVSAASMKIWAEGLTTHLLSRVSVHDKGALVSGLYSPISGACVARADVAEEAMIGLALARAADGGVLGADVSKRARDSARAIVRDLAVRDQPNRRIETSSVASAAFLLTIQALASDEPETKEAQSAARKEVKNVLEGPVRSPSVTAIAAWAAAGVESSQDMAALAKQGVTAIYRAVPVEKLATAMPWIVLAVRATEPSGPIASSAVLDQWRDLAYKFVMKAQDAGPDGEDLVGGIVFTGSRAPLPSAQSLRVIAGLAAMLNDERLTPALARSTEIVRLVPSLRFVRQMMGDEYNGTMFVDPLRAEWGVRNSMWDQRMSGEASALALMAICQAVDGAERGN
ncbi:MAG: hypothetical protein KF691_04935 [Phycisphaeraceae bacterium]|nr:hypothetical protein [Phycisphaeraceae bacterium]